MRIVAGELKGRRLFTPGWQGIRPTSDKLRETLFNVVSARVPGARVLDLYAGTGAIGLEALSRGAAHVTFVDDDRRAIALIEQNLRHCGVTDRYAIIRFRLVPEAPALLPGLFDLVVLDPPYDEPDLAAPVAAIMPLTAPDALVILEHARRRPSPERVGRLLRTREVVSGDSALAMYAQDRLTP